MLKNQIIQGSALTILTAIPSNSIDCCITSPPYWNLRDYRVEGQIGREKYPEEYIDNLIEIFTQVKRVIKDTGSIFVNIGDSYNENKSLVGVPERFAIQMTDRLGLIRRNTIIWHKPNPMPSSVKDRYTIDFEYLYFFTKSNNIDHYVNKKLGITQREVPPNVHDGICNIDWYWSEKTLKTGETIKVKHSYWESISYHFETQYEEHKEYDERKLNNAKKMGWNGELKDYVNWYNNQRQKKSWHDHSKDKEQGYGQQARGQKPLYIMSPYGRIKTTVWKISTRPFTGAHFATYPEELIRSPILATCPEFICDQCGIPRKHIYEEIRINTRPGINVGNAKSGASGDPNIGLHQSDLSTRRQQILRMPKFGGNKAKGYGPNTYSGNEYEPIIRRLKEMGADSTGNYNGQSTKEYEFHNAQDASETKRRILESYKRRSESKYVMTKCNCNAGFHSGTVLDPFFGAGTTALVALKNNRNFIGIELNPEYIEIARKRLEPYLAQRKIWEYENTY